MTMNAPQMTSVPRTSPWPTRLAQAAGGHSHGRTQVAIYRRMGAFLLVCLPIVLAACGGGGGGGDGGVGGGGGGVGGGNGDATTRTFDGSAADCFNPEFFTPGTTYRWEWKYQEFTKLQEGRILGNASFNGQSGLVEDKSTNTISSQGLTFVSNDSDFSRLEYRNSKPVIIDFGLTSVVNMTLGGATYLIENQSVYSPSTEYLPFTLAKGESYDHSETSTDTTRTFLNGSPVPGVDSQQNTESYKTTYLGQEKVTIAAGTFTACKFKDDQAEAIEYWVHRGSGIPLVIGGDDGGGNRVRFEMSTATSHVNNKTLTAYENGN